VTSESVQADFPCVITTPESIRGGTNASPRCGLDPATREPSQDARTGCRPVSGLAGLDRLPSRAMRAVARKAVRTGLPLRGQPRHCASRNCASPRSRFIGREEFTADTCFANCTRLRVEKAL
jgi:hypothetical protein